jgi:hypothetical protein
LCTVAPADVEGLPTMLTIQALRRIISSHHMQGVCREQQDEKMVGQRHILEPLQRSKPQRRATGECDCLASEMLNRCPVCIPVCWAGATKWRGRHGPPGYETFSPAPRSATTLLPLNIHDHHNTNLHSPHPLPQYPQRHRSPPLTPPQQTYPRFPGQTAVYVHRESQDFR